MADDLERFTLQELLQKVTATTGLIVLRKTFATTAGSLRAVLYESLDWIASEFARSPKERSQKNEDSLSDDLVLALRAMSFNASRETKVGGHCDVVVDERAGFLWLGEAKIDTSNSWLFGGFQQLGTRYSTGLPGQDHGGMLIYCKKANALATMTSWRDFLQSKMPGIQVQEDASNPLIFSSTHQHQGSGLPFEVRHLPFLIHWDPA